MNQIFFKIFPFLRDRVSNRASLLLSGFGVLSLIFLGLAKTVPDNFMGAIDCLYFLFLVSLFLIPLTFIISWVFDLKNWFGMRVVTVISHGKKPFPQNIANAKKLGYKYRKPTDRELVDWGLNKKQKLKDILKDMIHITSKELEEKRDLERSNDPDITMDEYIKIRGKQIRNVPL